MTEIPLQSSETLDGFCVQMQVGVLREWINVDIEPANSSETSTRSSRFMALKEGAANMVSRAYPEHKFVSLQNQLHLFLHSSTDPNLLKLITNQTDVSEGCLIQVVLSGKVAIEDLCAKQHVLSIHSYKSPHFCDFCGEMLWGLVKQGLKCEACGRNFHKRCVYKIREDCMAFRPSSVKISLEEQQTRQVNGTNSILPSRGGSVHRLQVPHTFVAHNYTLPTVCQHCHKLLPLLGQSLQCKDCKINCHKKCMDLLPNNCQGEARGTIYEASEADPLGLDSSFGEDTDPENVDKYLTSSTESTPTNLNKSPLPPVASVATQATAPLPSTPSSSASDLSLRNKQSSNIPLQRVVQSFRNVKQCASQTIRSDWMVWWTNHNPARRHHYWTLDSKSITFYSEEVKKRYFKVIQLKDIIRLELMDPSTIQVRNGACHVFEMVVGETTYCVGEDLGDERRSEVNRERAVCFENAIRQALLPLTPQNSNLAKEAGRTTSSNSEGKITDINQRYEINPEEVLGSGQFGIVYGAIHIYKKHEVAIKVIDKAKFKDKQEAQLKNEVSILQNISHPGVVNLEYVFESKDKIYVVMEKLKGDMLEMILSSSGSKLSERTTKFLVYQILKALKYLHDNNIVHCDLKPENVLLSSNSRFPQVKLCDFGFAKIIGERSFRRSIVGTPAYLAPEVLKNKRYNRSLDMWSVGVILYVSLSGTFPFNEDEDINDQIHNAAFMFPKNPWGGISKQAVDLITRILQVQLKNRFKVLDALNHVWMQDYYCYADLKVLEEQVGINYLTSRDDDAKWAEFAKVKKLSHWKDIGHVEGSNGNNNSSGRSHQSHTATL